jgi:hypothetical protein
MGGIGVNQIQPYTSAQLMQMHQAKWQSIQALPPLPPAPEAPAPFPADGPRDTSATPYQQFMDSYHNSFGSWDAQSGHKGYLNDADVKQLVNENPTDPTLRTMQSFQGRASGDMAAATFAPDHIGIDKMDGQGPAARSFDMPAVQHVLGDGYQQQADYSAFLHRYQENFNGWDAMSGKKGYLTNNDIDTLMQNPNIKGDDAAALGSVKSFMDGQKMDMHFNRNGAYQAPLPPGSPKDAFPPSTDNQFETSSSGSMLGTSYAQQRTDLANTSHELFAHDKPDWQSVRQRDNGDCYLQASLSSMAKESPDRVKNMVAQNQDGTYTVHFPGHDPVNVPKPTDAELAHYGSDGSDGTWSTVISKAYGTMRYKDGTFDDEDPSGREPADGSSSGTAAEAIRDLTGHGCKEYDTTKLNDKSQVASIDQVRQGLVDGLQPGRVAVAGTLPFGANGSTDGGLPSSHEFTVTGYDKKSDTITLRNPYGNDPESHVSPDIHQDKNGMVSMTMPTFMKNFYNLNIEDPSAAPTPTKKGEPAS